MSNLIEGIVPDFLEFCEQLAFLGKHVRVLLDGREMDGDDFLLLVLDLVADLKFVVVFVVDEGSLLGEGVGSRQFLIGHTVAEGLGIRFGLETGGRPFLQTVCIAQSVEGVFGTATAGTHTGEHDRLVVLLADETVPQNHSQFAASEGHMLGVQVDGSDALLQSQQGLVNLGPLHPPLLVVRLTVLGPFRPRQVYHQHFPLSPQVL